MVTVEYRSGRLEDSYHAFRLFRATVGDMAFRMGLSENPPASDPEEVEKEWQQRRSLFEHLANTGENFCLAMVDQELVGYARSIFRDGVRELTEFFVLPGQQSAGIGRELLGRVFPADGARHRAIIATTDVRALVRYLKSGVYARFPIYNFSREPRPLAVSSTLVFEEMAVSPVALEAVREIDRAVLGYTRDADHAYWMKERQGFLYWRENRLVGYGYVGYDGGPFALVDEADFPDVLGHAEQVASQSVSRFHIEVPLVNRTVVDYLLANAYQMSPFTALLMTDEPFGKFENYILPAPPFAI